jgi:hypothetical protein
MVTGSTGGGRRSARHGDVEVCSELSEDSPEWSIKEAVEEGTWKSTKPRLRTGTTVEAGAAADLEQKRRGNGNVRG